MFPVQKVLEERISMPTLEEHLNNNNGPKRILALDGGGVRGMFSLGILSKIEELLANQWVKSAPNRSAPDFRLCDYFDLIAGTSTGAIIAAALAKGMSVAEIVTEYTALLPIVFKKKGTGAKANTFLAPRYSRRSLLTKLDRIFGSTTTLRSDTIKTGLMITAKRLDTGDVYIFHNNPNDITHSKAASPYRKSDYTLAKIVRASTAAPTYFAPEHFPGRGTAVQTFVDGGVSPLNNPALGAFMVATIKGFGYEWANGENNLLLVSVGTGWSRTITTYTQKSARAPKNILRGMIDSLINDSDWLGQGLLQWMSKTQTPFPVHSSMGDLVGESLCSRNLLTYLRYSAQLQAPLMKLDNPKNSTALYNEGVVIGGGVQKAHFPSVFDI